MPTYCFTNKARNETIEGCYPMGKAPSRIRVEGVLYERDIRAEHSGQRSGDAWTTYTSVTRGVPVDQMQAAMKLDAELGVPTQYEVRGPVALPKITSKQHDIRWLKAHEWVNSDAGYGYPAPGDFKEKRKARAILLDQLMRG